MKANTCYDTHTAKFAATVLTCMPEMPSDVMQGWIENPKSLKRTLQNALCPPKEDKLAVPTTFKTLRTLKLGTGLKTGDDFRTALKKDGHGIGDYANNILGKPAFTASETETEVELVIVTVAELGFKKGANHSDIYTRAQELGLMLCPAEVGPQLRLQYKDQRKGECVLIGMEPITTDGDGGLRVFSVRRYDDGGQWLSSESGYSDGFSIGRFRWVFLRRK